MDILNPNDPETCSEDLIARNVACLKTLVPEAFNDGQLNFEVLRELLGGVVDDDEEKYGLNWLGKQKASRLAMTPSSGTLRPRREESVDWTNTQNLMIEGDNLEVLKLLQKSYSGKVKLIYIDPPYNSGDDFVYPDNYQDGIQNYLNITGQIDGDGAKLSSKTEASGRFHTKWLNMMYPRLKLAREMLRRDGLIFISIGDFESGRLRVVLDEIFGEENFEGHVHWRRRHNQPNDRTKMLGIVGEHLLCYAKDSAEYKRVGVGKVALTGSFANPDDDPRGEWSSKPWKVGSGQSGSRYSITTPTGKTYDEEWMGEQSTFDFLLRDQRIIFPNNGNGPPRKKYYRHEREEEGQCATNWWHHDQFGHNQGGNDALTELFSEKNIFSNPKPLELIKGILSVSNTKSTDIVMDFFAGSGSTAHAVMEKNAIDRDSCRYILVQLPEPLDLGNKDHTAAASFCDSLGKAKTISEITKERLRRAGKAIKEKNPLFPGDLGFRVFKLDTSNIKAWDPRPEDLTQGILENLERIKPDRNDEDILYELLLKMGVDLCCPITTRSIAGKQVAAADNGGVIACLADQVARFEAEPLARGIVEWQQELGGVADTMAFFRDSAFADDVTKTNLSGILQQHGIKHVRSI